MQLVAWQVLQKVCILVGASFENAAIEIFVDQEMTQAP